MRRTLIIVVILAILTIFFIRQADIGIPSGEVIDLGVVPTMGEKTDEDTTGEAPERAISTVDGVRYSVPPSEILVGCSGLDCIPSVDDPSFSSIYDVDRAITDESVGLGLLYKGEARFYPYQMLVQREIVNDVVSGDELLVTYCPLCATGVVFDRNVDGVAREFGVSGFLWQSNLVMYDRPIDGARELNTDEQSLWSQVLGEAIAGAHLGTKLSIVPSDTVTFGAWRKLHPDSLVLDERVSLRDPYGDYYTNDEIFPKVNFDANDSPIHAKTFVIGVVIDGLAKAYPRDSLVVGKTADTVGGNILTITKNEANQVEITDNAGNVLPQVRGFWFSWVAVYPETLLFGN